MDGVGKFGLSTLQKVTAIFCMLAYGTSAYSIDEYVRINESTVITWLKRFCRVIIEEYEDEYLIIEDERDEQEDVISTPSSISNVKDMEINEIERFWWFIAWYKKIKDRKAHFTL